MRRVLGAAGVLILLTAAPARAQPPAPARAELPVREVVLSNGDRRYAVPLTIGATAVTAGLDTGSVGLRVLPGVLGDADARPTSRSDTYAYGAGAKLDGVVGQATVAAGDLKGATTMQLVRKVGCSDEEPRCAAGRIPMAQYGIQGDGLPGEGFKAILGVNMGEAEVPGLFKGIGARRWIVELPRPGESAPGRIVLNPTPEETAGYVMLPVLGDRAPAGGGLHDAVSGCLIDDAKPARLCGAVLLDSGAPGIRVATAEGGVGEPWPNGTPATLALADADGHPKAAEALVIGQRAHASRLSLEAKKPGRPPAIFTGAVPPRPRRPPSRCAPRAA